jgi:hypothetical protein
MAQDREDLRQDIIVRLAEVAQNNGHKPLTEGAMVRVASYVVMEYWHDIKRKPTILSLEDEDGNKTELWQTIADDKAIDLDAWLDARRWLLGCPKRLVEIAYKKASGEALSLAERKYLCKMRKNGYRQIPLATGRGNDSPLFCHYISRGENQCQRVAG